MEGVKGMENKEQSMVGHGNKGKEWKMKGKTEIKVKGKRVCEGKTVQESKKSS